jgi:hypothetical protein
VVQDSIWGKHELPFPTHARAQLWGVTGHMWYALKVTLLDYGVVVCNSDQKLDNSIAPDVTGR